MPVPLPADVCEHIAAFIHADGSDEHRIFSTRQAARTHDKLALTSWAWLSYSRKIRFETLILRSMTRLCDFLDFLQDQNCTFILAIRKIHVGERIPNGYGGKGWVGNREGWLGDYTRVRNICDRVPHLQGLHLSFIDHADFDQHLRLNSFNDSFLPTNFQHHSNIVFLLIRPDFFIGLAELYSFLAGFPDLQRLALYGAPDGLLETLPEYLPTSVTALRVVEDPSGTGLLGAWRPSRRQSSLTTPPHPIVGVYELHYYSITDRFAEIVRKFLIPMCIPQQTVIEVAYPPIPNGAANSGYLTHELEQMLAPSRAAAIIILNEERKQINEPAAVPTRRLWQDGDPETDICFFLNNGWEIEIFDDRDSDSDGDV